MASFKDCLTQNARGLWESLCKDNDILDPADTPELEDLNEIAKIMQEPPTGELGRLVSGG